MDERRKFSKVAVEPRTWLACVLCSSATPVSGSHGPHPIQHLRVLPLLLHILNVLCEDLESYRPVCRFQFINQLFFFFFFGSQKMSLLYIVLPVASCLSVVSFLKWFELWRPFFFLISCTSVVIRRPSFNLRVLDLPVHRQPVQSAVSCAFFFSPS